ncbi:S-adenosyl-L-methionine-dependent methyltransferase [Aspergillus sclerotiicarbonarius CBS 121057]|uniref:S-adenosyl-L-methionine-dependent methyltransferase n=1 Tax=Aspergillus sclerotiicarbonarius (strain CBS 121057 / IBT 28362) TaxID=1448318 RepID=A0A319FE13_ASPSB|nr:S-adenosyl-L-methionine-dependent methyltransferase [Aspergillus sclerotiicarbonarius CBS 121057]
MTEARITQLGQVIGAHTKRISDCVEDSHHQPPAVQNGSRPELPGELSRVRRELLDATLELQQLLLGPKEALFLWARNNQGTIHAVCEFDLARAFPIGATASFGEISQVSGLPEHDVRRIVRHAATEGIFRESPPGTVQHTAASQMLAEDEVVRDYMNVCYREIFPAMQQTVPALKRWPGSEDRAQAGFSLSQPGQPAFFDYLGAHPERARTFASAMSAYSSGPENDVSHLCHGYPWQALGPATVVDVGGSTGYVSVALAEQFPQLDLVVQDTAETIGRDALTETPRVKRIAHDFFTPQPIHGADVYLLRMVLHDFVDADCVRILRALIPALKDGAKVVLNEFCLPEPGTAGLFEEKQVRTMDMNMLSLFNSRERDTEDWKRLLAQADGRFRWERVLQPEGSNLSIIEVSWQPVN